MGVPGLSILTNVGAMAALQQLSKTQKNLLTTQLRVTTGLKVNGPKDDASTFAIAQRMRGDIAGIQSVEIALANADSVVNTAISGGKAIADLLTGMKAKVVQANQAGLDTASRTALNNDFTSLRDQLTTIGPSEGAGGLRKVRTHSGQGTRDSRQARPQEGDG